MPGNTESKIMNDNWEQLGVEAVSLIEKASEYLASIVINPNINFSWPYIKYASICKDAGERENLYIKAFEIEPNEHSCIELMKHYLLEKNIEQARLWLSKLILFDNNNKYIEYFVTKILPNNFDAKIYASINNDLQHMSDKELMRHYVVTGFYESRSYTFQGDNLSVNKYSYVPREDKINHKIETNVRVIAHYFPQYHVIPENEEWWGKGFTDWMNVKKAKPLFNDHYQPHIPDDFLGYYDLTNINVQKKQIELAKQYGIHGFCFYAYDFNGKKLLEKPLENYLYNKELDLPFCICWANENWTRRWDGLDEDILIAQNYNTENELHFIKEMSIYLKDPRYIRINGKPLLMVYRPNLIPNIKQITEKWRIWCKNNGVGEIYLVYPQSFTRADPSEYGFDASSGFPPNNGTIEEDMQRIEQHNKKPLPKEINRSSWNYFLEQSNDYDNRVEKYTHFPCIMPSWDNSARKNTRGHVFLDINPANFQCMTENAFKNVINNYRGDERIVFVNAWNEWAEGCHLEPDKKYGYAWLQAIKNAHISVNANFNKSYIKDYIDIKKSKIDTYPKSEEIAIFFHAYIPELLNEVIDYWSCVPELRNIWFIVTTTSDKVAYCKNILSQQNISNKYLVLESENKGRDILPFFKYYDLMIQLGIKVFCKLHSKISPHRRDGEIWRKTLFNDLLNPKCVKYILETLYNDTNIGIMLSNKYMYNLKDEETTTNTNFNKVKKLAYRLGLNINRTEDNMFPAGSMFWSKINSLIPMSKLCVDERLFEEETGQIDGCFGHACERLFCLSAKSIGLITKEIDIV